MLSHNEAIDLLRSKLEPGSKIASSVENDSRFEFHVFPPGIDDEDAMTNDFYCSVYKDSGLIEPSALLKYTQLFEPDICQQLLKTLVHIDQV